MRGRLISGRAYNWNNFVVSKGPIIGGAYKEGGLISGSWLRSSLIDKHIMDLFFRAGDLPRLMIDRSKHIPPVFVLHHPFPLQATTHSLA